MSPAAAAPTATTPATDMSDVRTARWRRTVRSTAP